MGVRASFWTDPNHILGLRKIDLFIYRQEDKTTGLDFFLHQAMYDTSYLDLQHLDAVHIFSF